MVAVGKPKFSARKVVVTSFLVDLLDIILNLVITLVSGSVIMLTELMEGIADLLASGFLYIGLRRAMKKEDRGHPFGYGREIYFWALLSALIMFGVTSTLSIYFGWDRFNDPKPIHDVNLAIIVLVIALVTNGYAFLLSKTRLLRNRSITSIVKIFYTSSLIETKTIFILDLMGTSSALMGILALSVYVFTGDYRYDGLGAIAIGITLAFFSVLLLLGIRDLLIGRSASVEVEERIKNAALNVDEVREILGIKTLHVGPERLLVDLDVSMDFDLSTGELEMLIDSIKKEIRKEVPAVRYLQVELENPADKYIG
jgi:cation diffusion facilitator family transporter